MTECVSYTRSLFAKRLPTILTWAFLWDVIQSYNTAHVVNEKSLFTYLIGLQCADVCQELRMGTVIFADHGNRILKPGI